MMTQDQATRAHRAAVKLERLYHAYRATQRSIAMTIHKIQGQLALDNSLSDTERSKREQQLSRRKAHTRALDLAFAERIAQIEARRAELRGWSP